MLDVMKFNPFSPDFNLTFYPYHALHTSYYALLIYTMPFDIAHDTIPFLLYILCYMTYTILDNTFHDMVICFDIFIFDVLAT